MNIIKMNINELKHPEKNVRKHPTKQIQEMIRSVEKFEQIRPVVVDENNVILAGNGLVMAMKEMGEQEVDVLKYENLTEEDKKRLMIADNQIASLGVDDYGAIEEFIKEIKVDIPGYDDETLQMLVDESQMALESAMSYGTYPEEEVNRLKGIEADREENGIERVEQVYPAPTPQNSAPTPQSMADEEYEVQDTRRFVICPHCGEKIYI